MTSRYLVLSLPAVCILVGLRTAAQPAWELIGIPVLTFQMHSIYTDTLSGAVYFCGEASLTNDGITDSSAISVYHHGQCDTLGVFHGAPRDIIRWHDTLFACGNFIAINGAPIAYCAYYDSSSWHQCGEFPEASTDRFEIVNGDLYILGTFKYADGNLCDGIAKRAGSEWASVGVEGFADPEAFTNIIGDVIEFGGHLVVSGAVEFEGTTAHGVGIQVNGAWEPLGPGILGTFGYGGPMIVYQNELYVGGGIHVAEGNPGEGILKWTGSEFVPVGAGLQNANNQWAVNVGSSEFEVHDGLLYVAGQFWHAGYIPAQGVATWDGTNWCGLGGDIGPVMSMGFLGDTLFVSPAVYQGQYSNTTVRYIGTYPDTCTNITTAVVPATARAALTVRSDASGVHVVLPAARAVQLVDAMGRIVGGKTAAEVTFPRAALAPGAYMVLAEGYKPQRVVVQ